MSDREKTAAISSAIFEKYLERQSGWAVLREVTIDNAPAITEYRDSAGMRDTTRLTRRHKRRMPEPATRRIDFLLMRIGRNSKPLHERIALECKVSLADFRRDTPAKRAAWFSVSDRFAYVAPKGLLTKDMLPEGCGLLEWDPTLAGDTLKWAVVAPQRQADDRPAPFSNQFFAYLMTRACWSEYNLRKATP